MKKILASLLCLLLCASLVCCATETNENSVAPSETASSESSLSESSVAESSIADSNITEGDMVSNGDDVEKFPAAEEPTAQSPAFYTVNSMSEPAILLPFHTVENYPRDFVSAMCNNPIDRIWLHDLDEVNQGKASMADYERVTLRSEQLWKIEIDKTIEQLSGVWSSASQEELKQYADNALQVAMDRTTLSGLYWGRRGSMFSLIHIVNDIDAHRQVAFQLKYWLYFIETANGGQAGASLQFSERLAEQFIDVNPYRPENFSAVLCGPVSLVEMTHAPAYVGYDWETWADGMVNHPLNQVAAEEAIPQWQEEIQTNLQRVGQFMDDLSWVEQHGEAFLQHCRQEREFEERLIEDGFLADNDDTRNMLAWQELDAYRSLAFTYNYWALFLEEFDEDM